MLLHYVVARVVTALAVLLAARVVPGLRVKSFGSALVFAFVLGLLNVFVAWILWVMAIPFLLLTFGLGAFLVRFVINTFMFWLADKLVDDVEADGFGALILGSLITSVAGWGI